MNLFEIAKWTLASLAFLVILFLIWVWLSTYHPRKVQSEPVICFNESSKLKSGQKLKVLSWNVQYLAGKNYVFFYDLPNNSGPDERPSSEDIAKTTKEVARIIHDENPDIILLQELDDGAKRTDYQDQLASLVSLLPEDYACYASAFYWKASFVPHPRIKGKVGMKLVILSKYKIKEAIRHKLALIPANLLIQQFNLKRAVLEVRLPVDGADDFVVLNTHLDAFAQGTNTLEKQVRQVQSILEKLDQNGLSWIIGGDFNLLPPGNAYNLLKKEYKRAYREETEIEPLFDNFQAVPGLQQVNSPEYQKWFTHFPNHPKVVKPNKTIDYYFLSHTIRIGNHYVRQHDTLNISDHLPIVVEFSLP